MFVGIMSRKQEIERKIIQALATKKEIPLFNVLRSLPFPILSLSDLRRIVNLSLLVYIFICYEYAKISMVH